MKRHLFTAVAAGVLALGFAAPATAGPGGILANCDGKIDFGCNQTPCAPDYPCTVTPCGVWMSGECITN